MTAQTPRLTPEVTDFLTTTLSRAVRTPLHGLLGFLELLAMSDVDDDQRRLVEQLVHSSEELLASNDRLVLLLRVLGHRQIPRSQTVQVGDLILELTAMTTTPVTVHRAPGTPRSLTTDAGLLLALLQELLANAVLHGRSPVTLELAAAPVEGQLRITVADAGEGMPPAAQRQLLGSERAHLDVAGLLLVRALADLLGARCRVATGTQGTRVSVDVAVDSGTGPAALGDEPTRSAQLPARPSPDAATPTGLTVLLVEDNATNRLLAERQLARLGHVLHTVVNGQAGVEAALRGDFDVVLMDLHLPDIDGREATQRIRAAQGPGVVLPIVAITADATPQARQSCMAVGMDDVLTKPVDLQELGAALERARQASGAGAPADTTQPVPAVVQRVAARVDSDPEAVAQFVETFLTGLPAQRLRLQAALRRGQARSVVSAAQALRASSDTMGASSLAAACAALSAAAETEHLDTARVFLPNLLLQCQQLDEELWAFTDARHVSRSLAGSARWVMPPEVV